MVAARSPYFRTMRPLPHEPMPNPAMNMESTIETSALVTPNCAMDSRSQTISYRMPQNPDTKKKRKYQGIEPTPVHLER